MILRDSILSEQPLILREAPPMVTDRLTIQAGAQLPTLSLESVTTWMACCDGDSRAVLTHLLASDIDGLERAAHDKGYTEGYKKGLENARAESARTLSLLGELVQRCESSFDVDVEKLAAQCADIVSGAFVKIAGAKLASHDAALAVVLEVLRRVKEERELTIRVSELDLPVLQSFEGELSRALNGRAYSLVADARVELGGCIVESKLGSLDGRLDIQLRALFEILRNNKLAHQEAP
jgi:flagellar biosynthesis/type III secretory pathway protein FliH